jgi:hypothetical protein
LGAGAVEDMITQGEGNNQQQGREKQQREKEFDDATSC